MVHLVMLTFPVFNLKNVLKYDKIDITDVIE